MKEENNIEQWYKSIVDSNDEFPPDEVWTSVQDELDISIVWPKITEALDVQKRKSKVFYIGIAASIAILIGISGIIFYFANKSSIDNDVNVSENIDTAREFENIIISTPKAYQSEIVIIDKEEYNEPESVNIAKLPANTEAVIIEPKQNVEEFIVEPILLANNSIEISNQSIIEIGSQSNNQSLQNMIGDKKSKSAFSDLYVGITGQFANTWMLNNKTYTGLKSDELTTTNLSFGKNFGVLLGTNISDNITINTNLFWQNEQKQSYNEYINGRYVSNTITLDYYSILLQLNYTIKHNTSKHNLSLGAFTDIKKEAYQDVDGILKDVKNEYSNFDYGILLGYEYPIKITPNLQFNPGIAGRIGFNNIFSGNDIIPDYLNKTHNASLNLTFSLIYSVF